MLYSGISDNNIFQLSGTRFVENPSTSNQEIISVLSNSGLSVSEILKGSFCTPKNVLVGPHIGAWYKDYTSGRSFQTTFREEDGTTTTFVNKGNDVFEGNKYRRYHKEDGVYVGQEFEGYLLQESDVSNKIQIQALSQLGKTTYTTIPLSVSRIQNTLNEKGEIIKYSDYLEKILKEYPEYKEGLIRLLFRMGLVHAENIPLLLSSNGNKLFVELIEKFPMGTYMYLIKGVNTRIIEHRKIGKNRLEAVLRQEYPNCISKDGTLDKVKVLEEFCRRLGENLGITYSAGLTYKRKSQCVLIDTTLGGISMDNGHVGKGIEVENVISRLSEVYSTIYFFNNNVLEGKSEDIERVFRTVFIPEIINTAGSNKELIKEYIGDSSISGTKLSQSFYMVNDFGRTRKTLKKLSIIGIGPIVIHLPIVSRAYHIKG